MVDLDVANREAFLRGADLRRQGRISLLTSVTDRRRLDGVAIAIDLKVDGMRHTGIAGVALAAFRERLQPVDGVDHMAVGGARLHAPHGIAVFADRVGLKRLGGAVVTVNLLVHRRPAQRTRAAGAFVGCEVVRKQRFAEQRMFPVVLMSQAALFPV